MTDQVSRHPGGKCSPNRGINDMKGTTTMTNTTRLVIPLDDVIWIEARQVVCTVLAGHLASGEREGRAAAAARASVVTRRMDSRILDFIEVMFLGCETRV